MLRQVYFCTNFTASGSKWLRRDLDAHCLSLTQNLALKVQLGVTALKDFPKRIPYYYRCPAAQNIMEMGLCSKCGLYLASVNKVPLHEQMHKKKKQLHLIFSLNNQVSNLPRRFNLHAKEHNVLQLGNLKNYCVRSSSRN